MIIGRLWKEGRINKNNVTNITQIPVPIQCQNSANFMPKRVKIGKIDKTGKRLITLIKSMGQEDFLDLSGNPKTH
ncbi:MAG: hypothetical protein V2A53_01220 [bacterium]